MHQPIRPPFDRAAEHNQPWNPGYGRVPGEVPLSVAARLAPYAANESLNAIVHDVRMKNLRMRLLRRKAG